MLLSYLVDRLHLVDDVLAPPEQARLHKSPSTITDLPIQDSMLLWFCWNQLEYNNRQMVVYTMMDEKIVRWQVQYDSLRM